MTRILHIEDNGYVLIQRLMRHGFEVSIASDGLQGIEKARREKPNLILMDLGLPTLDGCGDYVAKPIVFERLLGTIVALIRGRSLP